MTWSSTSIHFPADRGGFSSRGMRGHLAPAGPRSTRVARSSIAAGKCVLGRSRVLRAIGASQFISMLQVLPGPLVTRNS
eukprot:7384129-Prymnesium_polylepis.1